MRVWVDCTAAAHPLVLRPIVERLARRRPRGRDHDPRVRPDARRSSNGSACPNERRPPRRRLGTARRAPRSPRAARARPLGAAAPLRPRPRPRLGRHRRRRAPAADPVGADAGLRARRPAAQGELRRRPAACSSPDAIPVDAARRRAGAASAKLFRFPGLKEDYYLADFEPDPAVLGELGLDRERRDRRRPPAARDLGLPRRESALRAGARPARRRARAPSRS